MSVLKRNKGDIDLSRKQEEEERAAAVSGAAIACATLIIVFVIGGNIGLYFGLKKAAAALSSTSSSLSFVQQPKKYGSTAGTGLDSLRDSLNSGDHEGTNAAAAANLGKGESEMVVDGPVGERKMRAEGEVEVGAQFRPQGESLVGEELQS